MKKIASIALAISLAGCHHGGDASNSKDDPYRSSFSMNESTKNDMGTPPKGEMSRATPGQMAQ